MAHLEATIRSKAGPILPGATVTVFEAGTLTPASLFSDVGLTVPIENPTLADSSGVVNFYVASSDYDLLIQRFDIKDELRENLAIIDGTSVGPTGPASGDLSGIYPGPTVDGIQGFSITNFPTVQGQVPRFNSFFGDITWNIPSAGVDPSELILTANQFANLAGDPISAGVFGVSALLSAANDTSYCITMKMPDSFYGVPLDFDILAESIGTSGDAFVLHDVANSTDATSPAHSGLVTIPAHGFPAFVSLAQIPAVGSLFDGMVQVLIGRDVSEDAFGSTVRVFCVRIRPTP